MNVENIDKAIAVMQRVKTYDKKHFYMGTFQSSFNDVYSENELLDCGSSCCFSGWLNIASEFADYPNKVKDILAFELENLDDTESISLLLGISEYLAGDIIYFDFSNDELWGKYEVNEGKDIKPEHIIDILERIKLGELS